jgi:hypothetical protein
MRAVGSTDEAGTLASRLLSGVLRGAEGAGGWACAGPSPTATGVGAVAGSGTGGDGGPVAHSRMVGRSESSSESSAEPRAGRRVHGRG